MKFVKKLSKVGSSACIIVDKLVMENINCKPGDTVEVSIKKC